MGSRRRRFWNGLLSVGFSFTRLRHDVELAARAHYFMFSFGRYLNVTRMECLLDAIEINVGVLGSQFERDIVKIVDAACEFNILSSGEKSLM